MSEGLEKDIETIRKDISMIKEIITKNRIQIAVLNVKAGLWGVLGGAIPIVIVLLLKQI